MIRSPIFCRTFGNIEIKIWSYPKELIKCLLKGLSSDMRCPEKLINCIGFRHCYYDHYGGCNCNEKVEDICFKYSIKAARQGNIFIPIEISDCKPSCQRIFISELKALSTVCENQDRHAVNIVADQNRKCSCLLSLPVDITNSGLSRCIGDRQEDNQSLLHFYEEIIKILLKNHTAQSRNDPVNDKDRLLQLCLENNISSEKIVSFLKCGRNADFNSGVKNSMCRDCEEKQNGCPPNRDHGRRQYNTACKPMTKRDCATKNGRDHMSMKSICNCILNMNSKKSNNCTHLNCKKDILDIKTILSDIITMVNLNESGNGFENNICDENKPLNSDEIIAAILQHLCKCQGDRSNELCVRCDSNFSENDIPMISNSPLIPNDESNFSVTIIDANDPASKFPSSQHNAPIVDADDQYITIIGSQPSRRSVDSLSPNATGTVLPSSQCSQGTLDACPSDVKTVILPSSEMCLPNNDSQHKAIKQALEVAGIPADLSEYISRLTPTEFNDGVTNLYYHVDRETGDITIKSSLINPCVPNQVECKTSQDINVRQSQCEDNRQSSYSHIIVDINIQPSDVDEQIYCENTIEQLKSPTASTRNSKLSEQSVQSKNSKGNDEGILITASAPLGSIGNTKTSIKSGSSNSIKETGEITELMTYNLESMNNAGEVPSMVLEVSTRNSKLSEPMDVKEYIDKTTESNGMGEVLKTSKLTEIKEIDESIQNSKASEDKKINEDIRKDKASEIKENDAAIINSKATQTSIIKGSTRMSKASEAKELNKPIRKDKASEIKENYETIRNSKRSDVNGLDSPIRHSKASEAKNVGVSIKHSVATEPKENDGSLRDSKASEFKELIQSIKHSNVSEIKKNDKSIRYSKANTSKKGETSIRNSKASENRDMLGSLGSYKPIEPKDEEEPIRNSNTNDVEHQEESNEVIDIDGSLINLKASEGNIADEPVRISEATKSIKASTATKEVEMERSKRNSYTCGKEINKSTSSYSKGESKVNSRGSEDKSKGSDPKEPMPYIRTSRTVEPLNMEGAMKSYSDNKEAYGSMNPPFPNKPTNAKSSIKSVSTPQYLKSLRNSKSGELLSDKRISNPNTQPTKSTDTVSENVILMMNSEDNHLGTETFSKPQDFTTDLKLDFTKSVKINEPLHQQIDHTQYSTVTEYLPGQESSTLYPPATGTQKNDNII